MSQRQSQGTEEKKDELSKNEINRAEEKTRMEIEELPKKSKKEKREKCSNKEYTCLPAGR